VTDSQRKWWHVFAVIGGVWATWLGYGLVLFIVMLAGVWFFVNVWPPR
jgi:hypothetical protein